MSEHERRASCGRRARSRSRGSSPRADRRDAAGPVDLRPRRRLPARGRRAPSSSSLRPEPTSPARPTISPAFDRRGRRRGRARHVEVPHPQHRVASCWRPPGCEGRGSRARGRSSGGSASRGRTRRSGRRRPARPSRRTVTWSARSKISFMRWETKTTATPLSRSARTTSKSAATWSSGSELVGSSRITTRASIESARAISTICCCSGRSEPAGTEGSMSSRRRPSISTAAERRARQSIPHQRFGLRGPRKMFSATESSGTSVVSWVTVAIPAASASAASPKRIRSPSR